MRQVIRETFWALSLSVSVRWLDLIRLLDKQFGQFLGLRKIRAEERANLADQFDLLAKRHFVVHCEIHQIDKLDQVVQRVVDRNGALDRDVRRGNVETVGKEALGFEIGK
jgi:hypothetical protein